MTIVAYLLLPDVIMNVLAPLACFKSISSEAVTDEVIPPPAPDFPISRMSMLPDEYCDGDFASGLVIYIYPGFFIYAILLPLIFLRQAAVKSHIIYRTGASSELKVDIESEDKSAKPEKTEEEIAKEKEKLAAEEDSVKFKFGFFFSGLVIARREGLDGPIL